MNSYFLNSLLLEIVKLSKSTDGKLDSLISTNKTDAYASQRGKEIYSQNCYRRIPLNQADIDELVDSFVMMETAYNENDIFTYALYVYKQLEAILNNLIKNTPYSTIQQDLVEVNARGGLLIHKVFSLYNTSVTGNNYDKDVIDLFNTHGTIPTLTTSSFNNKLRYFIWYFDSKPSRKNQFYLSEIPYQYLKSARNKIHGGSTAGNNPNDARRITEIESNKGKFFLVFASLLHEFHKRFFKYNL